MFLIRRIVGDSMFPTLVDDAVVVARRTTRLTPGDVVVLKHGKMEKIKRISKIEGSRIYLLGDNPNYSTDSRHFGSVPAEDVLAKVIWPRT
jgi:nickel-type superoxide dismutase maturation protease